MRMSGRETDFLNFCAQTSTAGQRNMTPNCTTEYIQVTVREREIVIRIEAKNKTTVNASRKAEGQSWAT
jgi:hypothetical protein